MYKRQHQDGVLKNRENYEIMTPESIGLNQIQLNLTSRSGRAAVKHRMDEMGYKESEYNLDNLYDAFPVSYTHLDVYKRQAF